ncbi:proteasome-interacting protein cic1 [Oleoguttula sp. CCFEE 5521]
MARTRTVTEPSKTVVPTTSASTSPYQIDPSQSLRAVKALARKLQSPSALKTESKTSLLADADTQDASDAAPVWLVLTTKTHITDKKRLKPGKIALPHPYLLPSASQGAETREPLRICLITADPQREYKDLVASPAFPAELGKQISRVIGTEKLKAKFSSFEAKRKLLSEHDVFLADDRIITLLPTLLGKVFYKATSKRPVPISLEGKRKSIDAETGLKRVKLADGGKKVDKLPLQAKDMAAEIQRALQAALVHLAPSTTTAVKVGIATQTPEQLQANLAAVVEGLVGKYIPQGWKTIRAIHLKGPDTVALPIWMADQLWLDETQILSDERVAAIEGGKGKKRKRTAGEDADGVIEVPGPDGKMRRLEKPKGDEVEGKKSQRVKKGSVQGSVVGKEEAETEEVKAAEREEKRERKEALWAQKEALKSAAVSAPVEIMAEAPAAKVKVKKTRVKAADLM